MKKKLLKSMRVLLVAAGLCTWANAWADVTETYTFKSGSDKTNYALTLGESFSNPSVSTVTMKYVLSDANNFVTYFKRLAVSTKHSWTERPYSGFSYTEASGNRDEYFSLCNMKNGDKFTINFSATNGVVFKSANATYLVESVVTNVVAEGALTSGTEYTVVADADEVVTVDFYGSRAITLTSMTITTANPTILEPSITSAAGVGYTALTITPGTIRGNGTGTVVTKYSYTSATDVKSNGATYTEVLNPTSSGTIYAYSYIDGGAESEVVSFEFEVIAPKLNTPSATFSSMVESSGSYYKKFALATDVSNIDGDVTISYKYSTDQSSWSDIDGTDFTCPAGTYYVKAVAENCDDSDPVSITSYEYKMTSEMDFADGTISLTAESGMAAYGYINSINFVNNSGFDKLIIKKDYGLSYYAGNSNGYWSVAIPVDNQVVAYRTFKSSAASGSFSYALTSPYNVNPSRDRYGNGTDQGLGDYTPVNHIATVADVVKDANGVVDLSSKVLWTGNIEAIATAVAALDGVKSVKIGHVGYGVTATQLNFMIPSSKTNCEFIQLPSNSFFETTADVANLRTNTGVVALYALTDANDYAAANAFTATAATYDRSFTKDVVSTICLPFAINAETAATLGKFYQLKSTTTTDNVVFEEVEFTDALKPYLFVPAATGTITIPACTEFVAAGDVTAQTEGGVTLNGSIASSTISSTIYGFASSGNLVTASSGTMNPFRAYLTTSTPGARLALYSLDGEATGIGSVNVDKKNVRFYNLQGQSVAAPTKGLYILNGKKVIIK